MSYTIKYSGSESEKIQLALQDIKNYLGTERFQALFDEIKKLPKTAEMIKTLRMQFAFLAGIEGYPVVAIIASAWDMTVAAVDKLEE